MTDGGAIEAVIFDFDGLILDTETPEFEAWQEIYRAHGAELPLAEWIACLGTAEAVFDAYAYLEAAIGRPIDRPAVRARRRTRTADLIAAQPVLPGVVDYIAAARERGLALAVASSSPRAWVVGHLTERGLIEAFDAIKTSDDVRRTKPDPELYLAALAALGVAPGAAIVLEDSPNGLLAARRAGCYCVAVPGPLTRHLPLEAADRRLHSLADLPLPALLDEVARERGRK